MARKYCVDCERFVEAERNFGGKHHLWAPFIIGAFYIMPIGLWIFGTATLIGISTKPFIANSYLFLIIPIIDILYYVFVSKPRCPLCNGKTFTDVEQS